MQTFLEHQDRGVGSDKRSEFLLRNPYPGRPTHSYISMALLVLRVVGFESVVGLRPGLCMGALIKRVMLYMIVVISCGLDDYCPSINKRVWNPCYACCHSLIGFREACRPT